MGTRIEINYSLAQKHAKALAEHSKEIEESSRGIDMNLLPMLRTGMKASGEMGTVVSLIEDRMATHTQGMHDVSVFLIQVEKAMEEAARTLHEAQLEQSAGR